MNELSRRECVKFCGISGAVGLSGCLRFSGSGQGTETTESDSGQGTETTESGSGQDTENTYKVDKFYLNNIELEQDRLKESGELDVSGESDDGTISGEWIGNTNIARSQACARYSFDILENGSAIASSTDKILTIAYQYALRQTTNSIFITYQPSVQPGWETHLKLSYPDGEYTLTPEIRSSEGVFEFEFSDSGVEPGRYDWLLEISPPDSPTIDIGRAYDGLVSINPTDGSEFPNRSEAIETVGSLSNTSATRVEPPTDKPGNGLNYVSVGHTAGSIDGSRFGKEATRGISLQCDSSYTLGSQVNRKFRINNLTTGDTLTFDPTQS